MRKKNSAFYLFTFSVVLILVIPVLIRDGMFMDAMLYTSVAKNMANGFGNFWFPQFSHCNMHGLSSFHEQPPLGFGLESLFFTFLGNSMYTERIYTFVMMCLSIGVIIGIWQEISANQNFKEAGWLPVILWISIPVCFWTYSNNMLEVTMTLFILLSAWYFLKYMALQQYYFLALSGISIFLASLTKGIPGLFTLSMPFLHWLCLKKTPAKKMIADTLILLSVPLMLYFILFLIPVSRESLSIYLFKRAFQRISDVPTVDSRFYILYRLLLELMIPIVITITGVFILRIRKERLRQNAMPIFFIFLGLAGSLPLLLTKVQKGFYFVPSLPFFAIGFALILAPNLQNAIDRSPVAFKKIFTFFSILLFFLGVVLSVNSIGKTSRDANLLYDVKLIGEKIPEKEIMTIARNNWNDWSLQCYLIRYHNISVDTNEKYRYLIVRKENDDNNHPGYKKIIIDTRLYNLYEKETMVQGL